MQNSVIIIYGKNPPAAKLENLRRQMKASGKSLMLLPMSCMNNIQALTDKAAELIDEKVVLQKVLRSKAQHRFFTEAELQDLTEQVQELEAQISCLIKKIEEI